MNNYVILSLALIFLTIVVIIYRNVGYKQIINPSDKIINIPPENGKESSDGNLLHVLSNIDGPRKDYYV